MFSNGRNWVLIVMTGLIILQAAWILRLVRASEERAFAEQTDLDEFSAARQKKLERENQQLLAELQRMRPESLEASASSQTESATHSEIRVLERLEAISSVKGTPGVLIEVPFTYEFFDISRSEVSSTFAEIFGLSTEETTRLNGALKAAAGELVRLEREHSTVRSTDGGGVAVEVASFSEEGGVVYDALNREVTSTLGPARSRFFNELVAESMEDEMGAFGAGTKRVTIAWNPSSGRYDVATEFSGISREFSSHASYASREELMQREPEIAARVPEKMWQHAGPASR